MESQVPGGVPGIFPFVRHGDNVVIDHVEPFFVAEVPAAWFEGIGPVLLQPTDCLARLVDELPGFESQPELHAVLRRAQVASRDLLNTLHAVAQRVAMHIQPLGRLAPVAVGLQEAGQALDQIARVLLVVLVQLAEHTVVEHLQRERVLQAEQQTI